MCSLFPKGNRICKKQLIDQWIAHDMIRLTPGVHYLEDIGDKHFQSLVQVSFLQDVDKFNGRVTCKMHDLVHDLARSILHDEFSTNVPDDATSSTKCYRYFSLIELPRKLLPGNVFNNARAIYVDKGNDIIFGKALKNAKHVRSIIINHILSTTVLTTIFQIKNLKYLEMSGLTCEALPEAITDIWSLQAVHLPYSDLLELPKSIGKLQKLRTLNLSHCGNLKCLPDSIGDCNMLLSLDLRKCEEITDLPNSIGRNEKLRVLGLGYTKLEKMPSSININTLRNLECLDLCNCWELAELPKGISNLHKLQILNLKSCTRLVELPEGISNLQKLQVLNLKYCSKLGGMPIGIGQLSQLQNLGLFVVGEGERFARISQLANVSTIGEELIIIGIEHVMEPDDAHKACLKLKSNLQRLNLEWKRCHVGEMNTELEQAVLDGLEPPPRIKKLEIRGYSGRQYACWMQNQVDVGVQRLAHFPLLRVMRLYDFPNLKHLHGLVELPFLEKLQLERMPSLESISRALETLDIRFSEALTNLPDCLGSLTSLQSLSVSNCSAIQMMPECLGELRSLHELSINSCEKLSSLPESMGQLASLQELHIGWCNSLQQLPECLGELCSLRILYIGDLPSINKIPQSLQHLTSLQDLTIVRCNALHELPRCLGELRSLLKFNIGCLPGLTCLPESMCGLTSLQTLYITNCPGIKSLPEGIKGLSSLKQSLGSLTSLQSLGLSSCSAIRRLPECLGELRSLQKLTTQSCDSLSSLPQSMGHLTSFQALEIVRNMAGVEAAALSAVVSGILKIVGNKLAPLVIKRYTSIVGVAKDVKDLQLLVEEINSWLERAEYQLKEVAYAVDDVVDEFQLKSRNMTAMVRMAANKMKAIKKRFAVIVKQRTDYLAITNSFSLDPPIWPTNMRTGDMASLSYIDEASIIISIIGLGGTGKTTLAKLVFNDGDVIKKHFEVRLWVHVSQDFDVDKLIKKVFEAFADNNPGQHTLPYMSRTVSDKLGGKRFLLVLDDVWTESQFQWEIFREFLTNIGEPGSRILLTTRSSKVAETVGSTDPMKLTLLSEPSSWQLFMESYGMAANNLASEFLMVGKDIVDKCGGVPLAIKVLAGVLRAKERIDQWKAMRDSNLLYVEGEEDRVAACLRLSYFHLPSHLKNCFTICSVFPKGHKIDKDQLINLWIAHDFITLEAGIDDLDYSGHRCFNSLVQVSFLQDVEEQYGRVTCRMHDLVHDLAQSIADIFLPNDESSSTKSYRYFSLTKQARNLPFNNPFEKARAIYVDKGDDPILGDTLKNATHLRSITLEFMYADAVPNAIFHIKNLKYLEISRLKCEALPEAISDFWTLQDLHVTYSDVLELPRTIGNLVKLRTLNLSWCLKLKFLPDSLGDCQMISSIDVCHCDKLTVLPNSIGKLQKLKILNLSWCKELMCLPDSIVDCQMISSIDLCNCWKIKSLPNSIGRNKKLRALRLANTNIERLPSSITILRDLEYLDLHKCQDLVELPEGIGNLEKLQFFILKDCEKLGGITLGIGQLTQLQKLGLFVLGEGEKLAGISQLANVSRISEELIIRGISHAMDPDDAHMACLKQKTKLERLKLEWKRCHLGEEQGVLDALEPPPGIKELEIRGYSGRQYAQWMQKKVSGGVQKVAYFQCLRVMNMCNFLNLKHLHGLVELPCLEELKLALMPSLESISGGPFPSLVKLIMEYMPCLGEVWILAERAMSDGEEGGSCSNCTSHLGQIRVGRLSGNSEQLLQLPNLCDKLSSSSSFSHLKKLELEGMTRLGCGHGWEPFQHMTTTLESLETMTIQSGDRMSSLPQSMGHLMSLQVLRIEWCDALQLPECLGELCSLRSLYLRGLHNINRFPQSLRHLTSLHDLTIGGCDVLQELPECLGDLCSLCKLDINKLPRLACFPESMSRLTSLEELSISNCPSLTSLPQGMKTLTSLKKLSISRCPGIESLPGGISGLTTLKEIRVKLQLNHATAPGGAVVVRADTYFQYCGDRLTGSDVSSEKEKRSFTFVDS
ncbi:hypothetical protein U9M48_005443 [Paspalum notatum var. saurae]|uniref:Uncharacterized protein n=1 Tax=Paspalum notatum var. saurae TaxID=547442 RepID=A0AAQ3PXQ3_PASNO